MADVVAGKALWEAGIDRSKIPGDAAAVNAEVAAAGAKGEQAATASATSTLAKVSGLARTAASTVALGAGAMFGVATKLAADGEDAMAKFQAQTGATRQEAEDALASMNRLAGQNLQSFGTISDALTQVTINMGVTGKAAEDATNLILKFSTATGTDAVQNVGAFDDVLDSWGKTAADLPGIMDLVIASTQKYGGTVGEATSALKDMAPALRGMGASMSDGIALLDLFRASGVDASGATAGLARAVKNLKPGQTLDDLIAQIGAIQDPTLRAQKAIEIFGKSGATLGNAIQPGVTSLKDFGIAATDAAGATDKAASAIEDTLPNKIKMAVDGALAQARGFATDFGPALLGASSLISVGTSIAAAFKLDDALKGALTKAWEASAADSGVLSAIRSTASKWAPTLLEGIGVLLIPFALQPLGDAVRPTENRQLAILTDPEANAAYLRATKQGGNATQAFLDAMTKAFTDGKSKEDAIAAATKAGDDAAMAAAKGLLEHDTSFKKAWTDGGLGAGGNFSEAFFTGVQNANPGKMWNVALGSFFEHDTSFAKDTANHMVVPIVAQLPQQFAAGAPAAAAGISDVLTHMWSSIPDAPPRQLGVHFGQQFVVGFKSTRDSAKSEWQQYLDDLAHPNRGQKTVGWIVGKLTGEDLAKGLASSDPIVRHSAEQTQQDLRVQLQGMLDDGYTIGKKTLAKLGLGIVDGKIVAITAAKGAKTDVNNSLNNTSGVYGYGADLVNRWAAGMAHAGINAATIAQGIVHRVGGVFLDDEPIRADAPEHIRRIREYGRHFIQRWVGGMWDEGGVAARSVADLGANITGSFFGGPMQKLSVSGATVQHQHSGTVTVRLSGETIAAARGQGASWDDIGRMARSANGLVAGLQMRLGTNG